MFISSGFLSIQYGVDDKIAKFFTDREPPPNNLYWKDKLMYLRPEPGWLFIPLIVDLLYKCGIDREQLLSAKFVGLLEDIGHISAMEETQQINHGQAIEACMNLVKNDHTNELYLQHLIDFIKGGTNNPFSAMATPFKALHRGDYFLFALCALQFDAALQTKLIQHWFALISTLLLLDDADDLSDDINNADANAFVESGMQKEGIDRIKELVSSNLKLIGTINRSMAAKLDQGFVSLQKLPHINQLLNQ
ncbi:MAG: hypothetical protein LH478_09195 [Chitinophagaceae bacterium]|nr:hypothetical protein [Chitinophagaceae bacterium]